VRGDGALSGAGMDVCTDFWDLFEELTHLCDELIYEDNERDRPLYNTQILAAQYESEMIR
jgi:hypothetical protein